MEKNDNDYLIIDTEDPVEAHAQLKAWRQDCQTAYAPTFVTHETSPIYGLTDGLLPGEDALHALLSKIKGKLEELAVKPEDAWECFLIYWYTRDHIVMVPEASPEDRYYYHYPLFDLFAKEPENILPWLLELFKNEVLAKQKLIDQYFACLYCGSAHLKFSESCPKCHHLELEVKPFIHCFSCGLVSPESNFIKQDRLICPKCRVQLRQVGEDYDRPLETGECLNCHQYYLDPEVNCHCMYCHSQIPTDHLSKQMVYSLSLTSQGLYYLREQHFGSGVKIFDHINYVTPEYFKGVLDWQLALKKRYPEEPLALLGVRWKLIKEGGMGYLQEIAAALRLSLRQTDILTRIGDAQIWVFLPKTDEPGLNVVKDKIKVFLAQKKIDSHLEVDVFGQVLTQESTDAQTALARLSGTRE